MPYASNAELPASVRRLYRDECQSVFRAAYAAAVSEYRYEGRGESRAFAIAHAAAKRCEERTGKAMEHGVEHEAKMKVMATRMRTMADEMDALSGTGKAEFSGTAVNDWSGKAEMTSAEQGDLPDSAFACIDAGGTKDATGRTVPRSLRHYPHHVADGELDLPHLRNALSRSAQAGTADCGKAHLEAHARTAGIGGR